MMILEFPWFERKFTFDLPVWMYPNVLERLRGTPARLEESLALLNPGMLTRRHGEDWSIQENAGHLRDIEALWSGRLGDFMAGAEQLRAADVTNQMTYDADHNAHPLESILVAFRRERLEFVQRLDELTELDVLRTAVHPRLNQSMRLLDHVFFVAEHDDHHLAQITRLKRLFL